MGKTDSDQAERTGAAIAAARDFHGLSQDELAAAAGTTASTISRYERGGVAPQAITLYRIAKALGVTVEFLMDPPATRSGVFAAMARGVETVTPEQAIARAREEIARFEADQASTPSQPLDDPVNGG